MLKIPEIERPKLLRLIYLKEEVDLFFEATARKLHEKGYHQEECGYKSGKSKCTLNEVTGYLV